MAASALSRGGLKECIVAWVERSQATLKGGDTNLRSHLLLAVVLASAVAAPAFGQAAAPAIAPSPNTARNAPSVPDFSGFWFHPGLGFGPPLSAPGPVRNNSR